MIISTKSTNFADTFKNKSQDLMSFHPIHTDTPKPHAFNNPFDYVPHPLCLDAAREVCRHVESDARLKADAGRGKMFGVLVVETRDGALGYLAAFSGLLDGSNDHPFFVPPVFDATPPDGYFKTHEAEISALNERIKSLIDSEERLTALQELDRCTAECRREEDDFRRKMSEAKARRDEIRRGGGELQPEEAARLTCESQFMKAELRRLRKRNEALIAEKRAAADVFEDEIRELKQRRHAMSDSLQHWLFSRYDMLNARGERRNLCSIFADTPQRVPPAGAGDCCAPKLLQHAYENGLRPVCIAEFWYGASPRGEIRHHLHYYPSCRGKCLPILRHMLQGLDVEAGTASEAGQPQAEIVYEDRWLCVVCKPSGLMSVPGTCGAPSLAEIIRLRRPDVAAVMPVHRLDMDTSGLIIIAFDAETYRDLQRQFALRTVSKRYVAVLDGSLSCPDEGTISLPLCSDPLDRPYQKVDYATGKNAVTRYRVISRTSDGTRVALYPLTGRTHQLRVHCAHADGLGMPIVGDRLYGRPSGSPAVGSPADVADTKSRLLLHAEQLSFVHPVTGERLTFSKKADF